jgi:FKBP-type peptidyl-prolyl cis-trans isomerase 2
MKEVKENATVKVNYTGKLADGRVFDTSEGKEPLEFTVGKGMLIPGFEKGIMNMKLNEKKTITIRKEEGYGEIDESLKQKVSRKELPQEINPEVGMQLVSKDPSGQQRNLIVTKVKNDSIEVDANHPLAGKELVFDLEVIAIS